MKKSNVIFTSLLFAILILYSISLLLPLFWGLLTSLKSRSDFVTNVMGFPKKWLFTNYPVAFSQFSIRVQTGASSATVYLGEMLLNSVIYNAGAVLGATFIPCIAAYLVAKYRFKFSKIVYNIVIITMLIPIIGATPSTLRIMRVLGLYDTFFGLWVLKSNFLGMHFLLFYGTFKSLSWEYAEAAIIDGASHSKIMFSIMFALVKTTIGIIALLNFIAFWNDYQVPMLYLPSRPTAAFGMFAYSRNPLVNSVPAQISGCMILVIPIFILFMIFRNKMIGNLTMGGLKG